MRSSLGGEGSGRGASADESGLRKLSRFRLGGCAAIAFRGRFGRGLFAACHYVRKKVSRLLLDDR